MKTQSALNRRGGHGASPHCTAPDPETSRPITKWAVRSPHPAEQLDDLTFFYDEQDDNGCVQRTTVDLRMRWFTRFELELLLEAAGWRVEEPYGDHGLGAYGPTSDRILLVATPAPGRLIDRER